MVTALIFAGGTGRRMNSGDIPKQFLKLHGKPVIIYTMEHFEAHKDIDNIVVVCIEGWMEKLKEYIALYRIKKVSEIVVGGDGADISTYNGLKSLSKVCESSDLVLIHDGVRPLIDADLITSNINKAKKYKSVITVEPAIESVIQSKDGEKVSYVPPRGEMYTAKAPQTFEFGLIWDLYQRAQKDGYRVIDSAHLCSLYGVETYMVKSTPNNIKITAPQDYYIFRSLVEAIENKQLLYF